MILQDSRRKDFTDKTVPKRYRVLVERAFAAKCSPRQAIKAKCLDCSCYQQEEVAHCQVVLCPLHPFRPYQPKG